MDGSETIDFWLDLAIAPGKRAEFEAVKADTLAAAAGEPGTLAYAWMRSGDHVRLHERYRDSAAAIEHLAGFRANFAQRFGEALQGRAMSVFGPASPELRASLARHSPEYFDRVGAFLR